MSRSRKARALHRLVTLLFAGLVVLGGCKGAQGGNGKADGGPKGRRSTGTRVVSVQKVENRQLIRTGNYRGELRAEKVVEVAPDVQGRIKKLFVDMGSVVKKGDLLVELDPMEMNQLVREGKAGVDKAKASVSQAQVVLEKAQLDLERKQPLAAKGLVTEAEMADLLSAVKSADSGIAVANASQSQASASLKNLTTNRKNLKVRALFDGVVARRYLNEGAMASPSSPVFQLHAEGKLYMRIAVPEKDVAVVTEGMTGTLAVDAVMGRSFMFTVALVSPIIEQVTRTCTVDLLVTVGEGETVKLKPGMTGEATLVLDQQDGVLAVPRDAIVDREGETVVFKVVDDRAVMVPVKVLGEYGDFVMAEGVAEGDELVLKGQVDLEDGVAVAIATLE